MSPELRAALAALTARFDGIEARLSALEAAVSGLWAPLEEVRTLVSDTQAAVINAELKAGQ